MGNHMKQLKRTKSLTNMATDELREAIVTGQFELGEPLSEIQLASSMGTSKTPIREAFAQLKREGLVNVVPQSGTFVFTLSSREVAQLCELRSILEKEAFKLAYKRNKEAFIEGLKVIVMKMTEVHRAKDIPKYLRLDTEFHEQLFRHCDNQYIADAYSLVEGKIAALRTHTSSLPQHTLLSLEEHHEFVNALEQSDIENATIILKKHIGRSKETYAENIEDISRSGKNGLGKGRGLKNKRDK